MNISQSSVVQVPPLLRTTLLLLLLLLLIDIMVARQGTEPSQTLLSASVFSAVVIISDTTAPAAMRSLRLVHF
jgi:hypothetical protein